MERIEDTISVLIFFTWDTMLANQNDGVVDVEVVTLSSGMTNLPILSFRGGFSLIFSINEELDWPLLSV